MICLIKGMPFLLFQPFCNSAESGMRSSNFLDIHFLSMQLINYQVEVALIYMLNIMRLYADHHGDIGHVLRSINSKQCCDV